MCCPQRFIIMPLICIFILAFYAMTSSPGALQHSIIKYFFLSNAQYSSLFSVSSWASLLDVLHGYIIDRWLGLKVATLIYVVAMVIGNCLYITAAFTKTYWLLFFGRALFGLGGNPALLCINGYILHWFEGKEINLMYSVNASSCWMGSSLIYFVSLKVMKYFNSVIPASTHYNSLSFTICAISSILTVLVAFGPTIIALLYRDGKKTQADQKDIKDAPTENNQDKNNSSDDNTQEKTLKSIITFPLVFWLFSLTVFLFHMAIVGFVLMSQLYLKTKYLIDTDQANNLSGVFNVVTGILAPVCGLIVDKLGRNLLCFLIGVTFGLLAQGLFAFTSVNPLAPVILLAVASAMGCSSWSIFGYLSKSHQQIMAFGIAQTGTNASIAVGGIAAGYVVDSYGYINLAYFFFAVVAVTEVILLFIWLLDMRSGSLMNLSQQERKDRMS